MIIYIHTAECEKILNVALELSNLIFFHNCNDLKLRLISRHDVINCLVCVNDIEVRNTIEKSFEFLYIIKIEDLLLLWNEYPEVFSRSYEGPLKDSVFYFYGFDNISMNDWKVKSLLMGAVIEDDLFSYVTHVILYRMSGSQITIILDKFKDKMYSTVLIDYYWKKCGKRLSNKDRKIILESSKIRLFNNCRFGIIGFRKAFLQEIIKQILVNGGSLVNLSHVSMATHIICKRHKGHQETLKKFSKVLPSYLNKIVIDYNWIRDSLKSGYLLNWLNYQIPIDLECGNIDDIEIPTDCLHKEVQIDQNDIKELNSIQEVDCNSTNISQTTSNGGKTKRFQLMEELMCTVSQRSILLIDFISLSTNKLLEHENLSIFFYNLKNVAQFFNEIHELWLHIVKLQDNDCCFGLDLLSLYHNINDSYLNYQKNYIKMIDKFEQLITKKPSVKELFEKFCKTKFISDISYCLNVPIKSLLTFGSYFNEIISSTPSDHHDFKSWHEINNINNQLLKALNRMEDESYERRRHYFVSRCLGSHLSLSTYNRFWTYIDCMLLNETCSAIPVTVFIFDEFLLICELKNCGQALRRYEKILKKIRSFKSNSNVEEQNNNMTNQNDNVLVKKVPVTVSRSTSRCNTLESFYDNFKSVSFKMQFAKFSKVFTGLSKLNLNKDRPGTYHNIKEIKKSNILSVCHNSLEIDIISKLIFTIEVLNSETCLSEKLTFQLMPRVVKELSDYKSIKLALPNEFEWDNYGDLNNTWDKFIEEEIENICYFLSQMIIAYRTKNVGTSRTSLTLKRRMTMSNKIQTKSIISIKSAPLRKTKLKCFNNLKKKSFQHILSTFQSAAAKFAGSKL